MSCRPRSPPRATRGSTSSATTSTKRRRAPATRSRPGPRSSGSARRRASTSAPSRRACCRRPSGATGRSRRRPTRATGRSTASGSRATRSSSRSARRTCSSRRSRWRASTRCSPTAASSCGPTSSRTPRRAARPLGAVVTASRRPPPQSAGLDPTALAVVQDGLYQATHASYGTSASVFGNFPIPIAGKTGTAQKDPEHQAEGPVVVVRLRAGRAAPSRRSSSSAR